MQAWGSEAAIQRLPAAQQAYMTAALGGLLARLSARVLERTPGLLPALIAGVGARLDSPLPAIRFRHMRDSTAPEAWDKFKERMRMHVGECVWFGASTRQLRAGKDTQYGSHGIATHTCISWSRANTVRGAWLGAMLLLCARARVPAGPQRCDVASRAAGRFCQALLVTRARRRMTLVLTCD